MTGKVDHGVGEGWSDGAEDGGPRFLYSVPEAARLLSVSRSQVYDLMRTGELVTVTVGRRRLVPAVAITDYVERLVREVASAA